MDSFKFFGPRSSFDTLPYGGGGDPSSEGEGDGEGEGEGDDETQPSPPNPQQTANEVLELLQEQVSGDGETDSSTVETLVGQLQSLTSQVQELQSRVPGEDEVVLSEEQKEALERYQEYGDPEDLEEALNERDELKERVQSFERRKTFEQVAEAMGWDEEALKGIAETHDLDVRMTDPDEEGEDPEPVVITEDEEGEETTKPIGEYVDENLGWVKPSLDRSDGGPNGNGTYPAQSASSDEEAQSEKVSEGVLESTYSGNFEDES